MTNNTKDWIDKTVGVDELRLDLENPRLPKHVKDHNDETQIRNYLLDKEGIMRIARSIANNGYHRSAVSIAYQKGKTLIVLDGNRRLAASQFLANPSLVPTARERKEFEQLAKKLTDDALSSMKVTIAPSRRAAEKEIWDIHVTQLSKPWEVLQKLRMYKNLIGTGDYTIKSASLEYGITEAKFKNELARLFFYEKLLEVTDESGEEELLKSGFNKIQRLILSYNGKKLLDFVVNDDGEIVVADESLLETKIKKLEPYITDPSKISAQATQDELVDDVYSNIDPSTFQKTTSLTGKTTTPDSGVSKSGNKISGSSNGSSKGTQAKSDWITDSEFRAYSGASRVKNILQELKRNKPAKKQNLNMTAVTLRVVIELAIYDKLSSKGSIKIMVNNRKAHIATENAKRAKTGKPLISNLSKNWTPSLKEMLAYMSKDASGIITDPQERKAIDRLVQTKKEFVDDLDNFVHNVSYNPSETTVKEIWETFGRLIFDILKKI